MNVTGHLPIELLSAHLDGETSPEERARVEAHLAECESCRQTLEDLRRIAEASAEIGIPELPEGLREKVIDSIGRPVRARRAWIGAAASVAAVGLVATAWYLQGPAAPVPKPPPSQVRLPESDEVRAPKAPDVEPLKSLGYVGAAGKARSDAPPVPPAPPLEPKRRAGEIDASARATKKKDEGAPTPDTGSYERAGNEFLRDERAPSPAAKVSPAPSTAPAHRENVALSSEASAGSDGRRSTSAASESRDEGLAEVGGDGCGDVEFIQASAKPGISRRILEEALERQGALLRPEPEPGVLAVVVPRRIWPDCRTTLVDSGVLVDEARVEAVPGMCIGVKIRFATP